MTNRVAKFKEFIKTNAKVEMWNYDLKKPAEVGILKAEDETFIYTYFHENKWREDEDDYGEWLDENLKQMEIYNSPLGQALK